MKTIDLVEQIKDRLDIVEFIRQYVPGLKRAGKTYKACCPFHQEKTPSFTCSSEKGLFYCFGCQEGGDIFGFLMKIENLSFREALQRLADLAGIDYQPTQALTGEEQHRAAVRKVLDFARQHYHKNFMSRAGDHARAYVKSRHLTKETCEHFELGLSAAQGVLTYAAKQTGYTEQDLKDAGLCIQTQYGLKEYFRNRLMFPIWNQRGDTVGFGGRILGEGEPKYLNSPETILFTKSHILYGLNFAGPAIRKAGRTVLLEGYMDVIGCHQAGVEYTVAPLGTSFTNEHARLLKRYTQNVIVLFDPDEAGLKAALRGALILTEEGLFVKVAGLPDGLDPDEYIVKYGKENFEAILDGAQDLIAFALERQLALHSAPLSAQDKTEIVTALTQIIAKQPDGIVRREWVKFVAERLTVDEPLVLERLTQTQKATAFSARYQTKPQAETVRANTLPKTPAAEEDLLSWILKSPQYCVLCSQLTADDFSSPALWQIFQAIVQAHRENPQSADVTEPTVCALPQQKNEIIKLALLPTPDDFEPARDIAACAAKLEQAGLQKKLQAVTRQMKTYGTGNVPPEVFQTYMQLQRKLKQYRS
ncbi:MAG: DNA primase [Elusimicrobiaceae bacterium]|nr:DNA primase [Elusimicrobiaceae bacterium]